MAATAAELITSNPLVVDMGSGIIKAGFAGSQEPKLFLNIVGKPKHTRMFPSQVPDEFVGATAEAHRGLLRLSYPMSHGVVTNWDDMELVWKHIFSSAVLAVPADTQALLVTDSPQNPRANRERLAELLFEKFNVPALLFAAQAPLSLYASGSTTGVVLDCGDGVTQVVPVCEGFAVEHAVRRSDVGGRDVTERLQWLMRQSGNVMHTSAEKEIVRQIKEQKCVVATNLAEEEKEQARSGRSTVDRYQLPDGQEISLGTEIFQAPEVLFQPSLIGLEYQGVHQCLAESISKVDVDLRRSLLNQMVLAGGSTLFRGFGERLLQELKPLSPAGVRLRIAAPKNRLITPWLGGYVSCLRASWAQHWEQIYFGVPSDVQIGRNNQGYV